MKKSLLFYCILGLIGIIAAGFIIFNSPKNSQSAVKNELLAIDTITHGHGLSVDVKDPTKLYIATHHGLLLLQDDKKLYKVGSKQDDYMGFSSHPTDSQIFFSSGHPEAGGNIGFQKSVDRGYTWEKISDGIDGPVDFHALTVSSVNPNLIFGWYQGNVQRSVNQGKTWEAFKSGNVFVGLTTDPKNENVVYAISPRGLFVSKDKGETWKSLIDGFVSAIAVNPNNPKTLLSYSEKNKLAKSEDAGKSWNQIDESFKGEPPLYIAYYKKNPKIVYILTEKNSIYKSLNEGTSWMKIR